MFIGVYFCIFNYLLIKSTSETIKNYMWSLNWGCEAFLGFKMIYNSLWVWSYNCLWLPAEYYYPHLSLKGVRRDDNNLLLSYLLLLFPVIWACCAPSIQWMVSHIQAFLCGIEMKIWDLGPKSVAIYNSFLPDDFMLFSAWGLYVVCWLGSSSIWLFEYWNDYFNFYCLMSRLFSSKPTEYWVA